MKTLQSTFCLLSLIGMVLVACRPARAPTEAPTEVRPTPTAEETTEKIPVRWFIGIGSGRSTEQMRVARTFTEQFNASQERIELILEAVTTDTHEAVDHLLSEIEEGTAPDLIAPAGTWGIYQFPEDLLPLDALLETIDLTDLDPQALKSWWEEGKTVGFPLGVSTSMLFYNRQLFDKADLPYPPHQFEQPYANGEPWTVDKMEEIAMRLTLDNAGKNALESDFNAGLVVQWGFHWQWDSTASMAAMFGPGSVVDAGGNARMPEQWRTAFHWYYAGMWEKYFIPSTAQTSNMQGNPFRSGKISMVHSFLWYAPRIMNLDNWDLAAVPAYNGKVTTRLERNGVVLLKTTQHPNEALEVAMAMAHSPELMNTWGIVPAFLSLRPSAINILKAQMPEVDWQVAVDSLNYGDSSYEGNMPNYRQSYDRLLEFRDLISSDKELDIDAELNELTKELQDIFTEVVTSSPN